MFMDDTEEVTDGAAAPMTVPATEETETPAEETPAV